MEGLLRPEAVDWWRAMLEYAPTLVSGATADQLWGTWSRHAGFIVGSGDDTIPTARLPSATPKKKVDIVIGGGAAR